jgi:hypothetical protein
MTIGFTGTRFGMTQKQKSKVTIILKKLNPNVGRHGDCIGSDTDFHNIAISLNISIVIHPPIINKFRAFNQEGIILEEKDYLVRNKDIVKASNILIATPDNYQYTQRSGTWSTINFAKKSKIPFIIVYPSGIFKYNIVS